MGTGRAPRDAQRRPWLGTATVIRVSDGKRQSQTVGKGGGARRGDAKAWGEGQRDHPPRRGGYHGRSGTVCHLVHLYLRGYISLVTGLFSAYEGGRKRRKRNRAGEGTAQTCACLLGALLLSVKPTLVSVPVCSACLLLTGRPCNKYTLRARLQLLFHQPPFFPCPLTPCSALWCRRWVVKDCGVVLGRAEAKTPGRGIRSELSRGMCTPPACGGTPASWTDQTGHTATSSCGGELPRVWEGTGGLPSPGCRLLLFAFTLLCVRI